jgi:hypothetical protein
MTFRSSSENNSSKYKSFKLFGGKQFSSNDFNETDWVESLNNFRDWSYIKFNDPICIFQLLSDDLRKQILSLVRKKFLYVNTEDCNYKLSKSGRQVINVPGNILEILRNKEADCNIFATVIDKKERDIFNCQVIWLPNEDPKLIIHCIQKKFRERECKLKIGWMVIGYDINFNFNNSDFNIKLNVLKNDINELNCKDVIKSLSFEYDSSVLCFGIPVINKSDSSNNSPVIGHYFFNDKENRRIGSYIFSYCPEKNHYINLPRFTFYTLIISDYPNSDNYGILPFKQSHMISNLLNYFTLKPRPKFVSLYSTDKCGPIFLKQKTDEIKIKYISVGCNQNDCICKYKRELEHNLKYAFLDPIKVPLFYQVHSF